MNFTAIVIAVLLAAFAIWLLGYFGLEATLRKVFTVIILVALALYLVQAFGLLPVGFMTLR